MSQQFLVRAGSASRVPAASPIRSRQICPPDIDGIVDLLRRGFPARSRDFWLHALKRLSEHPTPPGFPKYGYVLESGSVPVGVVLLIFSSIVINGETRIRCSTSSWYVEPAFRVYAGMLRSRAMRDKQVTYFNITADVHTWPILEAQGFARYCHGRFVTVPALGARAKGTRVNVFTAAGCASMDLPSFEAELLLAHADYGCISLTCSLAGRSCPFVFLPLWEHGIIPYAYLAYCRHLDDFVQFAGPLGRFLARRGFPVVVVDANGPVKGLIGAYFEAPKYFKGPDRPRLGDLAYSERVLFGF